MKTVSVLWMSTLEVEEIAELADSFSLTSDLRVRTRPRRSPRKEDKRYQSRRSERKSNVVAQGLQPALSQDF